MLDEEYSQFQGEVSKAKAIELNAADWCAEEEVPGTESAEFMKRTAGDVVVRK